MARVHAIALVLVVAGGAGLWLWAALGGDAQAPPPLPVERAVPAAAKPAAPEVSTRETTSAPRADARPAPPVAGAPSPAGAPATPDAAAPANVQLLVRDVADQQPVASFRWRFRAKSDEGPGQQGTDQQGTGAAGSAALALAPGATGEVFVEAAGYTPQSAKVQVPAVGEAVELPLFLARAAAFVGIQITARDDAGAAVARLRLDLWQLPRDADDPPAGADPEPPPLWTRIGNGKDGVFALPDLPPGRLALRAQPVDERGDALPLQAWRTVLQFGGVESVPFVVDFRPGVVLAVTATADGGNPVELAVTVRGRGGETVSTLWRSRAADAAGPGAVGRDVVTLPGRAATLLALPPGDYALELAQDGQPLAVTPGAGDARARTFAVTLRR